MARLLAVILTIATCTGCVGMSTKESDLAAETMLSVMMPLCGGNVSRAEFNAMVEAYALEMKGRMTAEEIEDIYRIYSDPTVKELMWKLVYAPDSSSRKRTVDLLDVRLKAVSSTKALEKLNSQDFKRAIEMRLQAHGLSFDDEFCK